MEGDYEIENRRGIFTYRLIFDTVTSGLKPAEACSNTNYTKCSQGDALAHDVRVNGRYAVLKLTSCASAHMH